MLLGFIPIKFRFRGKVHLLDDICASFRADPNKALHPAQLAKSTGISLVRIHACLEQTPELFVKIPRRPDGLTRYRLTSIISTKSPEQTLGVIQAGARRETLLLWASGTMLLCAFLIVVVLIGPSL